jgi:Toprim domain
VSLGNMAAIALPPAIATVITAAQNDPTDSPAARALDRAAAAFLRQGCRAKIARPPPGIKDLNDVLRGSAA